MNYQEALKRAKFTAIILGVALLGMAVFVSVFSYLYKAPLDIGACGLCIKLNPGVASCVIP